MKRKHFLLLAAAATTGCTTVDDAGRSAIEPKGEHTVDAGTASQYSAEGVYDNCAGQGFFLVRKSGKLTALSSICTHRKCKLKAELDHTFYCPCHGSTFDAAGRVQEGPATRDLPMFPTQMDAGGHLLVKVQSI